jgi:hypothetical protein
MFQTKEAVDLNNPYAFMLPISCTVTSDKVIKLVFEIHLKYSYSIWHVPDRYLSTLISSNNF